MYLRPILPLHIVAALFVISSFAAPTHSNETPLPARISQYFASLDSYIEDLSSNEKIKSYQLDPVDRLFRTVGEKHPEFFSILRTNSKGKVVNEFRDGKNVPRQFRDIGGQKWYSSVMRTMKPYYGHIKTNEDVYLFWARPIEITKGGKSAFGGAVAAKIELDKALNTATEKTGAAFRIKGGTRTFLKKNWRDNSQSATSDIVRIKGIPELTVEYIPEKSELKKVASTAESQQKTTDTNKTKSDTTGGSTLSYSIGIAIVIMALIGILAVFVIRFVRTRSAPVDGIHIGGEAHPHKEPGPSSESKNKAGNDDEISLDELATPNPATPAADKPAGTTEAASYNEATGFDAFSEVTAAKTAQTPKPDRADADSDVEEEFDVSSQFASTPETKWEHETDDESEAASDDTVFDSDISSQEKSPHHTDSASEARTTLQADDTASSSASSSKFKGAGYSAEDITRLVEEKVRQLQPSLEQKIRTEFNARLRTITHEFSSFADTLIQTTNESKKQNDIVINTAEQIKRRISSIEQDQDE